VDFKPKLVIRDKEGHFILIKRVIHQKEIIIINLYAPYAGAFNFIKHILLDLKTQIHHNIVVVENTNTPLSPTNRSFRKK
jgi:hypothetical protein